ncbi:MAG: hypothetical protein JRH20_15400 [Deltaproteobacteria bacterium]|nr:hypothetical protein [Deltaproteobacteria bacterium]
MFGRLNRVLQLASLLAWVFLVIMLWDRARGLALGVLAAGGVMAFLTLLTWRLQRRAEIEPTRAQSTDKRSAHLLVTRMLSQLTRIQVAYLGQTFASTKMGKAWLKHALPRGYRPTIDEMHGALEAARSGEDSEGMRLALRLHALRQPLSELDAALKKGAKERSGCDLAHPAAFVITEDIALDEGAGEPPIVLVAAWNPHHETLIPRVDLLTIIETIEGKKRVRGQISFAKAIASGRLGRDTKNKTVFVAPPRDDDDFELEDLPLGFVLSGSDMV